MSNGLDVSGKLRGLDLFSGIGGLSVALAPWVHTVAYCEIDRYCQGVLLSRQATRDLDHAPIWDDIRTLTRSQLPAIDIICGGFPCQDISVAGLGRGLEGERSGLFFQILRLAEELEPTFLFLENVPGIRTRGAARVCAELASLGYDLRWGTVSAQEMGAPHRRDRWFLLAAHSKRLELRNESGRSRRANGESETLPGNHGEKESLAGWPDGRMAGWPDGRMAGWPDGWMAGRETEPNVGRVVDGFPGRVDQIRTLGNAVVPAQAREAFQRLMGLRIQNE